MTDDNDKTLKTYNENIAAYVNDQEPELTDHLQAFVLLALDKISNASRILELGSGTGRDADWIENHGYQVERTDGSTAFVDYIKSHGKAARYLNVLKDDLGGPYDLIYASAVLLHFTRAETRLVLRKIASALDEKAYFAIRMKEGDREEWTNEKMGAPRLMVYWTTQSLETELKSAGFDIDNVSHGRFNGNNWIMIIARKQQRTSA